MFSIICIHLRSWLSTSCSHTNNRNQKEIENYLSHKSSQIFTQLQSQTEEKKQHEDGAVHIFQIGKASLHSYFMILEQYTVNWQMEVGRFYCTSSKSRRLSPLDIQFGLVQLKAKWFRNRDWMTVLHQCSKYRRPIFLNIYSAQIKQQGKIVWYQFSKYLLSPGKYGIKLNGREIEIGRLCCTSLQNRGQDCISWIFTQLNLV